MDSSTTTRFPSPLRYPGGKSCLAPFFGEILKENTIRNGIYCEGFAGGAGAALNLLFSKKVDRLVLNDADIHIFSFWNSILNNNEEFVRILENSEISLEEWHRHREIYLHPEKYSELEIGFSTFFLNRSNRGGILPKVGPTGGYKQDGKYNIAARFKKNNLIPRLQQINKFRESIEFHNLDATDFMRNIVSQLDPLNSLIYMDPPYFHQGKNLYLNYYENSDHQKFSVLMEEFNEMNWIVSYDNTPEIKSLYERFSYCAFDIDYSVQASKKGKEIMFFSTALDLPCNLKVKKNEYSITQI